MIQDSRRLSISRLVVSDGEVSLQSGATAYQDASGKVVVVGLWKDILVPVPEDLEAQAKAKNISSLEWLRQKLCRVPYLQVTVL